MYIYKTTNLINGKIYIGQQIFEPEKNKRYIGSGVDFLKAVKEFGKENFRKEIICSNVESLTELNRLETFYIAKYNALDESIGYNLDPGGNNHTEKTRKKMSKSITKTYSTEEGKKNLLAALHTEEYRVKMSKVQNSKTVKEAKSEKTKAHWDNPDSIYNTKAYRSSLSDAVDKEFHSNKRKEQWTDPKSAYNNEQWVKKRKKALCELWADPNSVYNSNEHRQKLKDSQAKGELCANYKRVRCFDKILMQKVNISSEEYILSKSRYLNYASSEYAKIKELYNVS